MLWLPEQNDRLHARFAGFRTLLLEPRRAIWEGVLRPTSQTYDVRVDFELPAHFALNATTYEYYPRVYVLRPELEEHPDYELGPIPHVWWDRRYRRQPNLCLFRPLKNEWSWDDAIADTTLPDASEWLFFYEFWLATGRWRGGGEHAGDPLKCNDNTETLSRDALSASGTAALAGR